jgi:hypothetical protein
VESQSRSSTSTQRSEYFESTPAPERAPTFLQQQDPPQRRNVSHRMVKTNHDQGQGHHSRTIRPIPSSISLTKVIRVPSSTRNPSSTVQTASVSKIDATPGPSSRRRSGNAQQRGEATTNAAVVSSCINNIPSLTPINPSVTEDIDYVGTAQAREFQSNEMGVVDSSNKYRISHDNDQHVGLLVNYIELDGAEEGKNRRIEIESRIVMQYYGF